MLSRLLLVCVGGALMALSSTGGAGETKWLCEKNRVNGHWDCATPKAERQFVKINSSVEKNSAWFSDTFSQSEEKVFLQLKTEFAQDPWAMCTLKKGTKPIFSYDKTLRQTAPTIIGANTSEQFDKELTSFWGDIDLVNADRQVMADYADYNNTSGIVDLYGDVIYSDASTALYSQSAQMGLKTDKMLARDALFIVPNTPMRGSADVIYRESPTLKRLTRVAYTGCQPGNQDWIFHASKMKINDEENSVSMKNAWLEFKKVPLLYLPYARFALDDRRETGLLMPVFGMSGRSGFDLSAPFYWNIAPNYDATFTPRYMSKRGFMMGTDFRYLLKKSRGEINVEVLPNDNLTKTTRWGGRIQNQSQLSKHLTVAMEGNYVSDSAYFSDLNSTLSMNRNRYLKSQADLNYSLSWLSFNTHIDNYQNINPNQPDSNVPYRRLPQVNLNLHKTFKRFPLKLALKSQYVFFQRHFPDGVPEGQRLSIRPSISLPFSFSSGFFKPKLDLQHTQYWLRDSVNKSLTKNESTTLPLFSIDSGLFFERDFGKFGELTHTIEPRLFYLYVPYTDQSGIPNFDTARYDFNSSQLFRDNRYSGIDKIQDTNQLTAALTTRLMKGGRSKLKLTVGEIFYFANRKVSLAGNALQSDVVSNLVAELSSEITDELKFSSAMQWSFTEHTLARGNVDLHYKGLSNNILFNVGYRYRLALPTQAPQEQMAVSAIVPIYDGWSVIGLYRYSLLNSLELEHFYGIEKDTCCWRFRVIARQFRRTTTGSVTPSNSIYFQFELKGFTTLGDKLETFLQKNIYGYTMPTY